MIIWTTQGPCLVTRTEPTRMLIQSYDRDVTDSIVQTLELTDVEEGNEGYSAGFDRETGMCYVELGEGSAALWIQHELLNYVDYTSFGRELLKLRGESDAVMFEKFMMIWETK